MKADLDAVGGSGRVESLAAVLIRAAPEGGQAVLDRLGRDLERTVTIPSADGDPYGSLHWTGRTVHGTMHCSGFVHSYSDGLAVREMLQHSIWMGLVGRRLREVVELLFSYDAPIDGVERVDVHGESWTRFVVAKTLCLIDRGTGTLWP